MHGTKLISNIDELDNVSFDQHSDFVDWIRSESTSKKPNKALALKDTEDNIYVSEQMPKSLLTEIYDKLSEFYPNKNFDTPLIMTAHVFSSLLYNVLEGVDHRRLTQSTQSDTPEEKIALDGHSILNEAIDMRASDIHIEARMETGIFSRVRYRVDGILVPSSAVDARVAQRIIRAFFTSPSFGKGQLIAGKPGDGTFEYTYKPPHLEAPNLYTIRLNTVPLVKGGQKFVARIRAPTEVQDLGEAGYHESQLDIIQEISGFSAGIFLFVGPTNSGKSTSLNSVMSAIPEERCVVEIADPIEAFLQNCVHINAPSTTDEEREVSERMMEATVRQDTDILVLGEIRNKATVHSAENLAEQGKVVLSTLHTDSVIGIHNRLIGLGMKSALLTQPNFLRGGVAQKLIPLNCPNCSLPPDKMPEEQFSKLQQESCKRILEILPTAKIRMRNPEGCDRCSKGIVGRTLVAEAMLVDDTIRKMYGSGDVSSMKRYLIDKRGMVSLRAHAFTKIIEGMIDPYIVETRIEKIRPDDFPRSRSQRSTAGV